MMGLLSNILKSMASGDDDDLECTVCGGTLVFQDYGQKGMYQVKKYKCQACGNEVNKPMDS